MYSTSHTWMHLPVCGGIYVNTSLQRIFPSLLLCPYLVLRPPLTNSGHSTSIQIPPGPRDSLAYGYPWHIGLLPRQSSWVARTESSYPYGVERNWAGLLMSTSAHDRHSLTTSTTIFFNPSLFGINCRLLAKPGRRKQSWTWYINCSSRGALQHPTPLSQGKVPN